MVKAEALSPILSNGVVIGYKLKDEFGKVMDIKSEAIVGAIKANKINIILNALQRHPFGCRCFLQKFPQILCQSFLQPDQLFCDGLGLLVCRLVQIQILS